MGQITRVERKDREAGLTIAEAAKIYREEGLPLYPLYDVDESEE